ncbi:MAG: hypothetical protein ACRCY4_01720 [Brevinema sp.]
MPYPVRFLLPDLGYQKVVISGTGFSDDLDLNLHYDDRAGVFSTTLLLNPGEYSYQFQADDQTVACPFRADSSGNASLILGLDYVQFSLQQTFIRNNNIVLTISVETLFWQDISLNLQSSLFGLKNIIGKPLFYEGTRCWYGFFIPVPDEPVLAYFELKNAERNIFYGVKGCTEKEWAVVPFELDKSTIPQHASSDMTAIYRFSTPKDVREFERRSDYFNTLPFSHIDAPLPQDSQLAKRMPFPSEQYTINKEIPFLLRQLFTEPDDINPLLGLLGRFSYKNFADIPLMRIQLSDEHCSFWDLSRRNMPAMLRAVAFQLLCTSVPDVLFGEEIGLSKTGDARHMYWTKAKWNKEILNFYETLLLLRNEHQVLRIGHMRYIVQDCALWGVERFAEGHDSIFIFANHSKDNVVMDLTKMISPGYAIQELLTKHTLKRKRICTIHAEGISIYKAISTPISEDDDSSSI